MQVHEIEARARRAHDDLTRPVNAKSQRVILCAHMYLAVFKYGSSDVVFLWELQKVEEKVQRESWMTELPEETRKDFAVGARQFRQTTQTAFMDESWARGPGDKPAGGDQPRASWAKPKQPVVDVQALKREQLLQQQVEQYNQQHRAKSLVELHRDKQAKLQDSGEQPLRRSFDRETDLQVRKVDPRRKADMFQAAASFNSKFTPGSFT